LWTGTLINRLGGFVVPFLSLYLTEERALSVHRAGFVVSLFGLGQLLSALVGGALADRIGRRATMLLGLVLGPISMLVLGYARGEEVIGASALAFGFLGDLYRPAVHAAVVDLVPSEDRPRAFGILYWGVNLGFAFAPILAGMLSAHFELLFFGDAATTLCFAALVVAFLPETRPVTPSGDRPRILTPFRDLPFMGFVLINLMFACIFYQSYMTLPLDMSAHGISRQQFGGLIAINGFCIVLIQPFAIAIVQKRHRRRMLALAALLTGIGFAMNTLAHEPWTYSASIVTWTLGEIVLSIVAPTLVADFSPPELRGSYQGVFHMSWGAAGFLAPAFGSLVLERFGSTALWTSCLALGVICALAHLTARATPTRA
jgi:MFS family permease